MDNYWNLLIDKAKEFNISIDDSQLEQFKKYWKFLNEYNQHTNIVSNADLELVIIKHFIDSLSIGLLKDKIGWEKNNRLIDIGTGGGFPGIPIILINPNWKLCAIDSVGKKTKFLELLVQNLGIQDRVEIINSRAEDFIQYPAKRECFDIVTARAVSQLNILCEYCLPFVKKGGYFIAYKAKAVDSEVQEAEKAISILGGEIIDTVSYILPTIESLIRNLILIKKVDSTPAKYPRKAGTAKKNPL